MEPVLIPAGAPMRLNLGKASRIAAARGTIWLTVAGDPRDYVIHPGKEFLVPSRTEVVVEALGDAAVFTVALIKPQSELPMIMPPASARWATGARGGPDSARIVSVRA